jgi:tRNA-2-methylthio-N6-dimethylallyladenosine synthase
VGEKYFSIKVIGCQMNDYDGDKLRGEMLSRGWAESAAEDADFVIMLTCCVRDRAEQKAMSELGKFGKLWRRDGRPRIALLGCMASRVGAEVAKKFPWVRVVAGPDCLPLVPDAIEDSHSSGARRVISAEGGAAQSVSQCAPKAKSNRHKAYITIANGCDQFCSYCIVPYVRGRFSSRARGEILSEASRLVESGVIEITLLGQNVNTYGKDLGAGYRFADLLAEVASISGLRRLRFTTSHPSDFTDDILDVMASAPNVCPGINLPVQAGSDKVLREMNRRYTRGEYIGLVRRIREALPEVGLSTDLIVGFPGETEAEFEQSAALLEELRFDLAHTAAYSPREGTPAARRSDQIPAQEKARRLAKVNGIQTEISREINSSLVGRDFEVLLDEPAPKGEGLLQGRTEADKVVLVKCPAELAGTFQTARITGSSPWCLEGELI